MQRARGRLRQVAWGTCLAALAGPAAALASGRWDPAWLRVAARPELDRSSGSTIEVEEVPSPFLATGSTPEGAPWRLDGASIAQGDAPNVYDVATPRLVVDGGPDSSPTRATAARGRLHFDPAADWVRLTLEGEAVVELGGVAFVASALDAWVSRERRHDPATGGVVLRATGPLEVRLDAAGLAAAVEARSGPRRDAVPAGRYTLRATGLEATLAPLRVVLEGPIALAGGPLPAPLAGATLDGTAAFATLVAAPGARADRAGGPSRLRLVLQDLDARATGAAAPARLAGRVVEVDLVRAPGGARAGLGGLAGVAPALPGLDVGRWRYEVHGLDLSGDVALAGPFAPTSGRDEAGDPPAHTPERPRPTWAVELNAREARLDPARRKVAARGGPASLTATSLPGAFGDATGGPPDAPDVVVRAAAIRLAAAADDGPGRPREGLTGAPDAEAAAAWLAEAEGEVVLLAREPAPTAPRGAAPGAAPPPRASWRLEAGAASARGRWPRPGDGAAAAPLERLDALALRPGPDGRVRAARDDGETALEAAWLSLARRRAGGGSAPVADAGGALPPPDLAGPDFDVAAGGPVRARVGAALTADLAPWDFESEGGLAGRVEAAALERARAALERARAGRAEAPGAPAGPGAPDGGALTRVEGRALGPLLAPWRALALDAPFRIGRGDAGDVRARLGLAGDGLALEGDRVVLRGSPAVVLVGQGRLAARRVALDRATGALEADGAPRLEVVDRRDPAAPPLVLAGDLARARLARDPDAWPGALAALRRARRAGNAWALPATLRGLELTGAVEVTGPDGLRGRGARLRWVAGAAAGTGWAALDGAPGEAGPRARLERAGGGVEADALRARFAPVAGLDRAWVGAWGRVEAWGDDDARRADLRAPGLRAGWVALELWRRPSAHGRDAGPRPPPGAPRPVLDVTTSAPPVGWFAAGGPDGVRATAARQPGREQVQTLALEGERLEGHAGAGVARLTGARPVAAALGPEQRVEAAALDLALDATRRRVLVDARPPWSAGLRLTDGEYSLAGRGPAHVALDLPRLLEDAGAPAAVRGRRALVDARLDGGLQLDGPTLRARADALRLRWLPDGRRALALTGDPVDVVRDGVRVVGGRYLLEED